MDKHNIFLIVAGIIFLCSLIYRVIKDKSFIHLIGTSIFFVVFTLLLITTYYISNNPSGISNVNYIMFILSFFTTIFGILAFFASVFSFLYLRRNKLYSRLYFYHLFIMLSCILLIIASLAYIFII